MIRVFDLSMEIKELDDTLDNPDVDPVTLRVTCSETGFSSLHYRGMPSEERRDMTFKRRFRRFLLFGGKSEPLNNLLQRRDVRIINTYDFMTEQGTIVIVDYETREKE